MATNVASVRKTNVQTVFRLINQTLLVWINLKRYKKLKKIETKLELEFFFKTFSDNNFHLPCTSRLIIQEVKISDRVVVIVLIKKKHSFNLQKRDKGVLHYAHSET